MKGSLSKGFKRLALFGALGGIGGTAFGLEFGSMGNVSASIGGAGVALEDSQWGLFYNPGLLAFRGKSRFAYSFGASARQTNLAKIIKLNPNELASFAKSFSNLFGNTAAAGAAPAAAAAAAAAMPNGFILRAADAPQVVMSAGTDLKTQGAFGDFIKRLLGATGTNPTQEELKKFLIELFNLAGVQHNNNDQIDNVITHIKNLPKRDQAKLLDKFKDRAKAANQGDNPLLDLIIDNLDEDNLGPLAEVLKNQNNNIDVKKLLEGLGGLNVDSSRSGSLDDVISSLSELLSALHKNDFSALASEGIIIQLPQKAGGSFAMAALLQGYFNTSASFDKTYNRVIIGSDNSYLEIIPVGGKIKLKSADKAAFDGHSVLSDKAKHQFQVSALGIIELPVGYGREIDLFNNTLALGGALKFMHGIGYRGGIVGNFNSFNQNFPTETTSSSTVGFDLGAVYKVRDMNFGIVVKNINFPSFQISPTEKVRVNPQTRIGFSYKTPSRITYAIDADLYANNTLSLSVKKNQMIGGGVIVDYGFFDFRSGMMFDVINLGWPIMTFGANFLGFLDISTQISTKFNKITGSNSSFIKQVPGIFGYLPDHIGLYAGGGFSW